MSQSIQIWDHFFPLVFPKDLEILKCLYIWHREVGAKRYFNEMKTRGKIQKKLFPPQQFETIFEQKCSYLRPLLSITFPQGFWIFKIFGHPILGSGGKKTLKWYLKSEHFLKIRYDFRTFSSKNAQIWDHFFPLLFPQGFWISEVVGHLTSESGGKKMFKRYPKNWAYGQTNTQTHRRIFQIIESIGPEGRCFETCSNW